jgi:protein SCO1/2
MIVRERWTGVRLRAWLVASALLTLTLLGQSVTKGPAAGSAAAKYFTDTILVDQDGIDRRFYSDLIKGKVAIINVMFTTCENSCPVMEANFERIQRWLGPRLGEEVRLISISIDPETDTPPRLKAYAKRFNARSGWYFLSGRKDNVELILSKLGLYVEQKQDHLNVFLIGNDRTGLWKKALGVSDPDKLIQVVGTVLHDGG